MRRALCVAIHDVAPATWPQCAALLALLDEIDIAPITLLVVPDFHNRGRIDTDPDFVREITHCIARGDEVALHGYFHRDDAPAPRTPREWFLRRVLTAREGEFATLDFAAASQRIADGMRLFERLDWPLRGFVPPAWLSGALAQQAMRRRGMHYTTTHRHLIDLVRGERIDAPCITASPRSAWRRAASLRWMRAASRAWRDRPLLRIGLHPADADHSRLMDGWRQLLTALVGERTPLTKWQAVRAVRSAADAGRAVLQMAGKAPAEIRVAVD